MALNTFNKSMFITRILRLLSYKEMANLLCQKILGIKLKKLSFKDMLFDNYNFRTNKNQNINKN